MSILHTVNKSPFDRSALKSCLEHTKDGDAVLLIEDGVYGVLKSTTASGDIWSKKKRVSFYVLGPDLAARGLSDARLIDGIKIVDYGGFVELAAEHDVTQAWL